MVHKLRKVVQYYNIVVVVVSHIQRIGCQPEKLLFYTMMANPAPRGLLNREKKDKNKKSGSAHFPPPPDASTSRDASTCLGAEQVLVRLASVQGLLGLVG